jgi:hypothetical protein
MTRINATPMKKTLLFLTMLAVIISSFIFVANEQSSSANTINLNSLSHSTFSTAYNMGNWNLTTFHMVRFEADPNADVVWLRFNANAGDKIAITFSASNLSSITNGSIVTLMNSNQSLVSDPTNPTNRVITEGFQQFNMGRATIPSSGTYYIRINKTQNVGNFTTGTLSFRNRAVSGSALNVPFTPNQIANTGNNPYNANGKDSAIASMTISATSHPSIPSNAVVTGISTTVGSMSPSNQPSILHKVRPPTSGWIDARARVQGAGGGLFNAIPASSNIPVRGTWQFCYNALAAQYSTMSNIRISINFVHDPTDFLV